MVPYALRRLLQMIPVVVASTIVVFLVLRSMPGDPALIYAGPEATPEVVAAVRDRMALDRPLPVQYVEWARKLLSGDFGNAYASRLPVSTLLANALPATIELAVAALILGLLIGIPSGIIAAIWRGKPIDHAINAVNSFLIAVPNFWLGLMFILMFGVRLGVLPTGGYVRLTDDPGQNLKYLILPAVTLSTNLIAVVSRFLRSELIEVMGEDHIRTAHAKGVHPLVVILRHGVRIAILTVVTVVGISFSRMLAGAVFLESVFSWPGLGRLLIYGVEVRDYLLVQGVLLVTVLGVLLVNLIIDIVSAALDPRIRMSQAEK